MDISGADSGTASDNNTDADPSYLNAGGVTAADYQIEIDSTAEDAGADLRATVPLDFSGYTRDATPDQGAFEIPEPDNNSPTIVADANYPATLGVDVDLSSIMADDLDGDAVYLDGVFDARTITVSATASGTGALETRT